MSRRRQLIDLIDDVPRTVSSLARALGLARADIEADLPHIIRSARAAGHSIRVIPAKCRRCGFEFGEDRLVKPGKCPRCHGSWLHEPQLSLANR